MTPPRLAALAAAFAAVLLAIPWLSTPWPIGVDLPQHAAQIELLGRALGGDPALGVSWANPNSLVYWLLAAFVWIFGPVAGTKLLSWAMAVGATILGVALCVQRGTGWGYGVVAAVFLFNASLYWGFLPYQLGWVAFLGWLLLMLSPNDNTPRFLAAVGVMHLVVLGAHSLWFAAAGVAGVAIVAVRPSQWKQRVVRGLTALPAAGIALWFGPRVREQRAALGFDVEARWFVKLPDRLSEDFFGAAAFGNVIGDYVAVVAAIVVVTLVVMSQARERTDARVGPIDRELVVIGALMLVAVAALPDKYVNTIDFARRWAPHALAMLTMGGLANLVPRIGALADRLPRAVQLLGLVPLTMAVVWTASTWAKVADEELDGLEEAIDAIAAIEEPRTVGLNFVGQSRHVSGVPFLQQFAWVQAIHGGTLNFSFTEHSSGLVYDVDPKRHPWTVGLEWMPKRFQNRDLRYFDVVLVGGPPPEHARLGKHPWLRPLNANGVWRAYRVELPTRSANASSRGGSPPP